MKITLNKKNIPISSILVTLLILVISFNYKSFILDDKFNYILFSLSIITSIISSLLFSIKLETNNKVNFIIGILSIFISILFSYIIIELLSKHILFSLDFKRLLFNFIIIILLHLFIYALSNNIKLTIIIINTFLFLLGLVNYTIVCFRGTPFVPWDVLSLETAVTVAGTYTFESSHYLILGIVSFAFILSLALKISYNFKKGKVNSILRISFVLLTIVLSILFYETNLINFFNLDTNLWVPSREYSYNGFLASFLKQSKNLFTDPPNNYSVETVGELISEDELNNTSTSNNDSPHIIAIMCESYSDLSVNGKFETSEEYMSYFYSLKENTIRGNLHVSIFGSKTPNSEWEFLTNNSMAFMPHGTVPYQQYIRKSSPSLASTLKSQGYSTTALHSWYGSGYRRNAVYPLIGFDSFQSLETLSDLEYIRNYPSDLTTYKNIIKQFESKKENEKIFNFTVTMQNHSGYDYKDYEPTVFLKDMPNCPRVEQYLSVMKESDSALEYLINYFKNYNEKTIILFFGDHQPPYLEDEFWQTIMPEGSDEKTKYITPFIIWANYDIEEQYINEISLNYLSILLLDVAGLETTPYMNFLKTLQKDLPVITGNEYIDNNGNSYTFNDNTNYSEIINNYKLLQYNNMFDYKNRINSLFEIK